VGAPQRVVASTQLGFRRLLFDPIVCLTYEVSLSSAPHQEVSNQGRTFQALVKCKPDMAALWGSIV